MVRSTRFTMFYENTPINFSFETGLPASSPESEARHLINRLRLEFRTASQRQLEDAVTAAVSSTPGAPGEKIFQLAKASLEQLLTPSLDRLPDQPVHSEPPFRTEVKTEDVSAAPAS
jgi:hypothetical protein